MFFVCLWLFIIVKKASPPEIQPLDDAFGLLRDHSENATVSINFSLHYALLLLCV